MTVNAKILSWFGSIFIFLGISLLLFIFTPVLVQELSYQIKQSKLDSAPPTTAYQIATDEKEAAILKYQPPAPPTTLIVPVSFDFSLVIPKINVNTLVFANINSQNEKEYLPVLKKGVAQAVGSSLPDQPGPVFIFAHSTDAFYHLSQYNAVFFLLNKLDPSDDIYLFYHHRTYHYQVSQKQIVAPDQVDREVRSSPADRLILQTCYPPGTTLKRLLVIASPVKPN